MSRDFRPLVTYSTELVVDGQSVGFLVADEDKNLIMYNYKPEAFESLGGKLVVCCLSLLCLDC